MTSPNKRTKKRAGLIVFSVLALVGTGTVAWGHGPPGPTAPDPTGTIHACIPNGGTQKTVRVIAPTQTCSSSQSGLDWPATGVLTGMVDSGAPMLPLTLPAGAGSTASATLSCPTGKVAIGLSVFTTTAPMAPAVLVAQSRGGAPAGNTLTVTFANLFAAAATISDLTALCVTQFAQS
jgi:hypothetical protein